MRRAVSAAAIKYGEVMPLARISAMMGASAIARASANAAHARQPASRACGVAPRLIVILVFPYRPERRVVLADDGPILAAAHD
jgi:hypothetical protein